MHVKICRKEAKESRLFLRLIDAGLAKSNLVARETLAAEARELTLIFCRLSRKADDRAVLFGILIIGLYLEFGNWNLELLEWFTN